jgi:hypothetical protein
MSSSARRSKRRKARGVFSKNKAGKKNHTPCGYARPRMKACGFQVKANNAKPRR